ncbi:MAG: hypothetical protein K0R93_2990 [Anaerosolibacter sp.]|uniref:Lin0368 family putative glycerol transporter subunit n=1 Tax=Anaerosolibacter sp. TaxID=1872527 RepID=UPI0026285F8E|nr:hypothetical protein [Anaerosolibacter sp.]MDF2548092.1 hypothetical protein [Anaerosolibacter sp.]
MKNFRTMVGGAIAGMFVMSVWGAFAGAYGIAGGWFAGFAIIGTMWFMNHYVGVLHNPDGGAWVDMALAIGVCGTLRPVFSAGSITPLVESIPTLVIVILGGMAGGIVAAMFQKDLAKKEVEAKEEA